MKPSMYEDFKKAEEELARVKARISISFGDQFQLRPGRYGGVELVGPNNGDGADIITIRNAKEGLWLADQLTRIFSA